jgi:hypothetical protein
MFNSWNFSNGAAVLQKEECSFVHLRLLQTVWKVNVWLDICSTHMPVVMWHVSRTTLDTVTHIWPEIWILSVTLCSAAKGKRARGRGGNVKYLSDVRSFHVWDKRCSESRIGWRIRYVHKVEFLCSGYGIVTSRKVQKTALGLVKETGNLEWQPGL